MSTTVFIYPGQIEFPETCDSQTIKIYNPYDFTVFFHFQSTRPGAFVLSSVEGQILAQHSLDIVINLIDKTIIEEKFQVRIHHTSSKGPRIGEKILKVVKQSSGNDEDLLRLRTSISSREDAFHDLTQDSARLMSSTSSSVSSFSSKPLEHLPNEYFVYFALMISVFVLFLPHEPNPSWPDWCHVSVNLKLVAAYILGIVTVFIIRK